MKLGVRVIKAAQQGTTLIEVIVFLVIIGIALAATISVFTQSLLTNTDPIIRIKALELAQAQLDYILARKFDENTPTGGVPACNSTGAGVCLGIAVDSDFDDVGDFHNFQNISVAGYQVSTTVVNAGGDLNLSSADQARLITVTVTTPPMSGFPSGDTVILSAYKVNF